MKQATISILLILTLLAWNHKRPHKTSVDSGDCRCRIRELEILKAEETYLYHTKRFEQLRSIHPLHNKEVMEAELKMKLSGIDLEIAKISD